MRLAFFGGIYNNYLALEAAIADAKSRGADEIYCLGDLGAFGPHPDRVFPLIHEHNVVCIQGNYDDSIGNQLDDCQCGYTDPHDNYFAQISYDYTLKNTSAENREFLRSLPKELRLERDGLKLLLCHGSPRRTNEFLWESATSTSFLERQMQDAEADLILATHTGLRWRRELSEGREFVNVGVLGRPENDGTTNVWYTMLKTGDDAPAEPRYEVEFIPVEYDFERLATEMEAEKLPPEFVATVRTGWWTTCLEILPSKERRRGEF